MGIVQVLEGREACDSGASSQENEVGGGGEREAGGMGCRSAREEWGGHSGGGGGEQGKEVREASSYELTTILFISTIYISPI